ncbi:MAG: hypothetical protein PSY14_04850 [bacterium]|nr:hypothetical protein [bacterium]
MFFSRILNGVINAIAPDEKPVPTDDALRVTSASLTNPATRVEIPALFPPVIDTDNQFTLLQMIEKELGDKHGTTLSEAGRINIVYPRKHPLKFPGHDNTAEFEAMKVWHMLQRAKPEVEWVFANALNELHKLGRTGNQTSVHALTAKQEYVVYDNATQQGASFRFGQPGNDKKEFFIMIDSGFEQGTTMANLLNFIEANGGAVLGAAVSDQKSNTLQQKNTSIFDNNAERAGLRAEFNDVARNTGRVAEMALAFSASALRDGKDISPQQAIDMFEEKLNKVGNSVFAMTDGEASRMIQTVKGSDEKSVPFLQVLRSLDEVAGVEKKSTPKPALQAVTP